MSEHSHLSEKTDLVKYQFFKSNGFSTASDGVLLRQLVITITSQIFKTSFRFCCGKLSEREVCHEVSNIQSTHYSYCFVNIPLVQPYSYQHLYLSTLGQTAKGLEYLPVLES